VTADNDTVSGPDNDTVSGPDNDTVSGPDNDTVAGADTDRVASADTDRAASADGETDEATAAGGDCQAGAPARRVDVQVTVDLATLFGLADSPCELAGFGPILPR
jgi:hypothetical protein